MDCINTTELPGEAIALKQGDVEIFWMCVMSSIRTERGAVHTSSEQRGSISTAGASTNDEDLVLVRARCGRAIEPLPYNTDARQHGGDRLRR